MTNLRKYFLPHTAVLVECLDSNKQEIQTATASGFIRQENERFFLYTCWHAVTGLHPDRISIERDFMQRRYLRVSLQSFRDEGALKVIGGLRSFVVPLYEESDSTSRPLWYQVIRHTPHAGLNSIGLFVPIKDAVKIEIFPEAPFGEYQVITNDMLLSLDGNPLLSPGEKAFIVGYPYGYSLRGSKFLTPIVLTRFVAGTSLLGNTPTVLEGFGAPGMSGGPAFVERGNDILLFGIYSGTLYPDNDRARPSPITALGQVVDLSLYLDETWPWVREGFLVSELGTR